MVNYTFDLDVIEYFLLILVRISCFIFTAPFFSMRGVPNQTKIGLAGILSFMMISTLGVDSYQATYASVIGYAVIVFKEAITGMLLGFSAYICSAIVQFAGNIIDMDIGFSMVTEFDPSMNTQITITANMYYYFTLLFLLVGGMHRYLIRALCDSFTLIPVGMSEFRSDVLLEAMLRYMRNLFVLGFRIILPVFAVMLIMNVILGIMAKVAPQMNMFAVGIQLKLLLGFFVLFVTIGLLPYVSDFVYTEMKKIMVSIIEGMY